MYNNKAEALVALSKLSFNGLNTIQDKQAKLLDFLNNVSIHADGNITVLYSGKTADGSISFSAIAGEMKGNINLRVIDKTDAAKVIH
jgi:cell fate regulator YaaT (PSP1 superfamily)